MISQQEALQILETRPELQKVSTALVAGKITFEEALGKALKILYLQLVEEQPYYFEYWD